MSKNVHWILPFVDRNGVSYRIDIYDTDYVGATVTLQGADGVLVTDETSDDNIFTSVRPSTGTLHVFDKEGTLLEQIMPSNNTDRPMRVVRTTDNKVVWQGFLSCESYSQEYNGRPHVVDIPVNSMLQAMDSVRIETDGASTRRIIRRLISTIINKISTKADFQVYDFIAYPSEGYRLLENIIDISCLFSKKEISNEGGISYELDGVSILEVFSRLCSFMGWVARESGTTLYLEPIIEHKGVHVTPYGYFNSSNQQNTLPYGQPTSVSGLMSSLSWAGESHKKSIIQGARSVEVSAELDSYNASLSIPDCPDTSLVSLQKTINNSSNQFVYQLADTSGNFGSLLSFNYYIVTVQESGHKVSSVTENGSYATIYQSTAIGYPSFFINWPRTKRTGCFFCKYGTAKNSDAPSYTSALYLSGNNTEDYSDFPLTDSNYILKMDSDMLFTANDGYLVIKSSAEGVTHEQRYLEPFKGKIPIVVKFGDYYWNGTTWSTNFAHISIEFENGAIKTNYKEGKTKAESSTGFYIPIDQVLDGQFSIYLYPYVDGKVIHNLFNYYFLDILFTQLSIEYYPIYNSQYSDRSENRYYKKIEADYSNDQSISVSLATNLNNKRSPSILLGISMQPVDSITYSNADGTTSSKRPEKVLLGKMEKYYSSSRRIVSLIIEHPSQDIPLMTLTGYDGRKYLPLSESRNWQQDKSTITCFELPED